MIGSGKLAGRHQEDTRPQDRDPNVATQSFRVHHREISDSPVANVIVNIFYDFTFLRSLTCLDTRLRSGRVE